jgi:tetratricopeptide (TPR) repeat protein
VQELGKAIRKMPQDATVAEHLGDVYLKQRRPREALELYRRALNLENPDLPRLRKKIQDLELQLQKQAL